MYYGVVDEGVFALCEDVCGSLQRQLASLNELMAQWLVTTVAAKLRPGWCSRAHQAVGPIGRLGRWTADHVRTVAILGRRLGRFGFFAPKVETALSGLGGRRTARSRCRRDS